MKTKIETLKEHYPQLNYEDGYLYATPDDEGYLHDNDLPLDGRGLIEEYYEGFEVLDNPYEPDPTIEIYVKVSGRDYIKHNFDEDYNKALKSI